MADLIDRDAVKRKLNAQYAIAKNTANPDAVEKVLKEFDKFVDSFPAVNRWIPCSERLPEFEREVLVYVKGNFDNSIPFITTAYINSDCDWQSDYDGEVIDSKITHWMPLPEPPKNEENSDE